MTFNNSILIILKQNKHLDFNELFAKISSRYNNEKSAYSALSRAIKNLESLGKIKKKNNRIFITDKGLASIQIEMKEKLVLKLNEQLKNPLANIEELVQLLIVFTERANESRDLLQNARENCSFTIKDISELQERIEDRKDLLSKMASLIGMQEERLRELDFTDKIELNFDDKFVDKAINFLHGERVIIETMDNELIGKIPDLWKKNEAIIVEKEFTKNVFEILLSEPLVKMVIYLPKIKCVASKGKVSCTGSFSLLKSFEKLE
jgi:hypothetical protein